MDSPRELLACMQSRNRKQQQQFFISTTGERMVVESMFGRSNFLSLLLLPLV